MKWDRVGIVGTAESWTQTPWTDGGLSLVSLNDAYQRKGFVRADAWYDIHPPNKYFHPPKDQPIYAHQVPAGHYVRPAGHLDWLAKQVIPVFLHPEYQTLYPAAAAWPHARPFPKAAIEAHFGRYFGSSPAWIMAHAMLHGCRAFEIYGIHLATESEYIEQRPQFEFLIGRVLGPSKVTVTVKDGIRRYVTADGSVTLPVSSPVLSSEFQYGFQPRPRAALEPLQWEAHKMQVKRDRAIRHLKTARWWRSLRTTRDELWHYEAVLADLQDQMARAQQPKGPPIYG